MEDNYILFWTIYKTKNDVWAFCPYTLGDQKNQRVYPEAGPKPGCSKILREFYLERAESLCSFLNIKTTYKFFYNN